MNNNLYLNTIRIYIKAKKYSFGETMLYDVRSNKVKLVIIATDAGAASSKKIVDKCNSFNVKYITMLTKNELQALFNKNISSFGITDDNLAKKFLNNLDKGGIDYGKQ